MRILFITETLPFPARQGVELPLENVITHLAARHTVEILVLTSSEQDKVEFAARLRNVPSTVGRIETLDVQARSPLVAGLREALCIAPSFFRDVFNHETLKRFIDGHPYDVAWVSPFGVLGIVLASQAAGYKIARKIAVGQNDAVTTLYWDNFMEGLRGRTPMTRQRLLRGLRTPFLWLNERRHLAQADLIHVQTDLEKTRIRSIMGAGGQARLTVAPNGRKTELLGVASAGPGPKENRVLFMTHLGGGRQDESHWFLKHVWPRVIAEIPDAELLLVGTPPDDTNMLSKDLLKNCKICGYANDLASVFASVVVLVVPTVHGTGYVNRIADGIAAGVPIVACPEPLATIPGLEIGVHALKGDNPEEFAGNVIRLLHDRALRRRIAAKSRELGQSLPSWEETLRTIEDDLAQLVAP